jgi:hypothetical protein
MKPFRRPRSDSEAETYGFLYGASIATFLNAGLVAIIGFPALGLVLLVISLALAGQAFWRRP